MLRVLHHNLRVRVYSVDLALLFFHIRDDIKKGLLRCNGVVRESLDVYLQLGLALNVKHSACEEVFKGLLLRVSVKRALGCNVHLDRRLKLFERYLRHVDHLHVLFARYAVCDSILKHYAVFRIRNEKIKPYSRKTLDRMLASVLLLGNGSASRLLYRENGTSRCLLGIYVTRSRFTRTCKLSRGVDQILFKLHYVSGHLRGRYSAHDLMHVVNGCSVGLDDAANVVERVGICHLRNVDHLCRIRLLFNREHASHRGLIDLDLVGDQILDLSLTSCRALFLFPIEVDYGIQRYSEIHVLDNGDKSCRHRVMHLAVFLVKLIYNGHLVVDLLLCRVAALLKALIVSHDQVFFAVAHTKRKRKVKSFGLRKSFADKNIRLSLDLRLVLVSVINVRHINDLVLRGELLGVKIDVKNALSAYSRISRKASELVIHRVALPNLRRVAVEHLAYLLRVFAERLILIILRGKDNRVQVVVNNGELVLNCRFYKVFLNRLNVAELRAFPLIAVIESITAVNVIVNSDEPVVVSALLIKPPYRCSYNLFFIHLRPLISARLPDLCPCRRISLYCAL